MINEKVWRDLPVEEYAFPGPLRNALVAAILDGTKTSTTSLLDQYRIDDEPLPAVGARGLVVDSTLNPVCVTELTGIRIVALAEVGIDHVVREGEGYETVSSWRTAHEEFWHSAEFRAAMNDPLFTVSDETQVVLVRMRVLTDLELSAPSYEP